MIDYHGASLREFSADLTLHNLFTKQQQTDQILFTHGMKLWHDQKVRMKISAVGEHTISFAVPGIHCTTRVSSNACHIRTDSLISRSEEEEKGLVSATGKYA